MAKKAIKKLGAKKAPQKGGYSLEARVNDSVIKAKGASLFDALKSVLANPEFPFVVKTRVLLRYSLGKKETQRTYPIQIARRILKVATYKDSAAEAIAERLNQDLTELA